MGVQSCLKSVKSIGFSIQPCGVLMFRMRLEEVIFPNLTRCGGCSLLNKRGTIRGTKIKEKLLNEHYLNKSTSGRHDAPHLKLKLIMDKDVVHDL